MTAGSTDPELRLLEERVAHERELRQQGEAAIEHEREMRAVYDAHERELRQIAEAAVDKARGIQFVEYERRLSDLNNSHERALAESRRVVPQTEFDTYKESTRRELALALTANAKEIETERAARIRNEGALSTWKFIAVLLGLPGIVALLLALISVFGGSS